MLNSIMKIYHGSQKIIQHPVWGYGNPYNDYGLGFYCTESLDLAKEWACTEETCGFANCYEFNLSGLSCLNLMCSDYHILNWLTILLQNRIFKISNAIAEEGKKYLLDNYLPDYQQFDVIIGYRADDSYFSFANAFLNNTLSLEQLKSAMYLGKLGEQVVLKSQTAFSRIHYIEAITAEMEIYYPRKVTRDSEARTAYRKFKENKRASDAIYLIDILRQEWKNDDPRLR